MQQTLQNRAGNAPHVQHQSSQREWEEWECSRLVGEWQWRCRWEWIWIWEWQMSLFTRCVNLCCAIDVVSWNKIVSIVSSSVIEIGNGFFESIVGNCNWNWQWSCKWVCAQLDRERIKKENLSLANVITEVRTVSNLKFNYYKSTLKPSLTRSAITVCELFSIVQCVTQ